MPKRYLGDDGLLREFEANRRILDGLKVILESSDFHEVIPGLKEVCDVLGAKGFAIGQCQATADGFQTRISFAHGMLSSLDKRVAVSDVGWQGLINEDTVHRLDTAKLAGMEAFILGAQASPTAVYGTCTRAFQSDWYVALIVAADPAKLPTKSKRREHGHTLKLALLAMLANRLEPTGLVLETALSTSEAEVLFSYACGLSPAEIARARRTSVRTVRNQLDSVRRRISAKSNAHAVALATANGLIPVPSILCPKLRRDPPLD